MVKNNIFTKPFDVGTQTKLEIFKKYLQEWLPVFIAKRKPHWDTIFIYDFFAGRGKDSMGNFGSPLLILETLIEYSSFINRNKVKIKILFNEKDPESYKELRKNIREFNFKLPVEIKIKNESFKDLFSEIFPKMKLYPNNPCLIFLDQYGIKEITQNIFQQLISLQRIDFIFFISSSFVRRFIELKEFKSYLPISKEKFIKSSSFHSHRIIFHYYNSLVNTKYFLAPFSIKKGANIYGLIFGSNHSLGIEKFLKICWEKNTFTGDADYNIDNESIVKGQYSLFGNKPKKLTVFESELVDNLLQNKIMNTEEMYRFTFEYGCLPTHCNKIIRKLIKEKKIKKLRLKNDNIHKLLKQNIIINK